MILLAPVFADVEFVKFIVLIIILISSLVRYLAGAAKKANVAPRPARPPVAPPPAASSVDDEVEQFLRRNTQSRGPQPTGGGGKRGRAAAQPQPRRTTPPAKAPRPAKQASLSDRHVQTSISTAKFDKATGSLAHVDTQIEEHVHEAFDRQVGQLSSQADAAVATPDAPTPANQVPSVAEQLLASLSAPEGVRQAIVINELLVRPEHRW